MAKNNNNLVVTILILWLALGGAFFVLAPLTVGAGSVVQTTIKITICGDGAIDSGEQCDGANLNGASCISRGFGGGSLTCRPSCEFNTVECTTGSGGGGGGSSYTPPSPPETKVNFLGRAYPGSRVTLLKDAQLAAQTVAGPDANFEISLSGLSGGSYLFSLHGEDNAGQRSSLLTFPISVTAGVITKISGIFIAPTIALNQDTVNHGDNLIIFGQTAPASDVTIVVNSLNEFLAKVTADTSGAFVYNLDTSPLELGEHTIKARAVRQNEASSYSKSKAFFVGSKKPSGEIESADPIEEQVDYNKDARVNLIEFSIAAYWYKRPNPPKFIDLNKDNKVDLVDFSILAYYWTG